VSFNVADFNVLGKVHAGQEVVDLLLLLHLVISILLQTIKVTNAIQDEVIIDFVGRPGFLKRLPNLFSVLVVVLLLSLPVSLSLLPHVDLRHKVLEQLGDIFLVA